MAAPSGDQSLLPPGDVVALFASGRDIRFFRVKLSSINVGQVSCPGLHRSLGSSYEFVKVHAANLARASCLEGVAESAQTCERLRLYDAVCAFAGDPS